MLIRRLGLEGSRKAGILFSTCNVDHWSAVLVHGLFLVARRVVVRRADGFSNHENVILYVRLMYAGSRVHGFFQGKLSIWVD